MLWLLARVNTATAPDDGAPPEGGAGSAAVAVATHSVFLLALTSGALEWCDDADPRRAYFETGEMRTLTVRVHRE